jgi:hypothetical protein
MPTAAPLTYLRNIEKRKKEKKSWYQYIFEGNRAGLGGLQSRELVTGKFQPWCGNAITANRWGRKNNGP